MKTVLSPLLTACTLLGCTAVNKSPDKIIIQDNITTLKYVSASDSVRNSDGFITANVSGETRQDDTLFYSFIWFDKNGIKQNSSLSVPIKRNIKSGFPFFWTGVAPSANAVDYKVLISKEPIEQ